MYLKSSAKVLMNLFFWPVSGKFNEMTDMLGTLLLLDYHIFTTVHVFVFEIVRLFMNDFDF